MATEFTHEPDAHRYTMHVDGDLVTGRQEHLGERPYALSPLTESLSEQMSFGLGRVILTMLHCWRTDHDGNGCGSANHIANTVYLRILNIKMALKEVLNLHHLVEYCH